jgi:hypothetical protein
MTQKFKFQNSKCSKLKIQKLNKYLQKRFWLQKIAWLVMTIMESPLRSVMAGSYEAYEPAITKRRGDSRGVMTNQALLKQKTQRNAYLFNF